MARPKKKGLDYFPLDVGIFEDERLFDVQEKYGPLGEVIYLRLLCLIYKNGYYYKFDSIDKLAAIVIRSIGNRWTRNKQAVKEVILYLTECNLFSSELMQRNVITARSIQQRYLKALERNQPEITEYNLIGEKAETDTGFITVPENLISVAETPVFATETPVNAYNNDTKEKESKVKKSKVESISDKPKRSRFIPPTLEEVKAYCVERKNNVDPQHFIDYYESNGWKVGKNPMKDWKAAVRTWERNGYGNGGTNGRTEAGITDDFLASWGITKV